MYRILKKILFQLDAERAHDFTIKLAHGFPAVSSFLGRSLSQNFSLKVSNNTWTFPVGLAAGLDKNAYAYDFFQGVGFGAVEVGTVTPKAQAGNDKPRLFRYIEEESIRNCMGFNNEGLSALLKNLSVIGLRNSPLGVNIGKNKLTSDDMAHEDYAILFHALKNKCDYIVINVSSPNTPGLREHQTKDGLEVILKNLNYKNEVDLFVKIAPDIELTSVKDICELVKKYNLSGIVATNTTIMPDRGNGGVSGKLLFDKARTVRKKCLEILKEDSKRSLIGVGGFSDFEQMKEYWRSGGSALQIYSSFIFQGPEILKDVERKISKDYQKFQVNNFEDYLLALRESR